MKKLLIIGVLLSVSFGVRAHPLKMSTCIIEQNSSGETIVKFNFFLDDFQAHLEAVSGKQLDLKTYLPTTKKEVDKYVKKCFIISVSKERRSMAYMVSSVKDNVFHIEYKLNKPLSSLKGLTIENKLLMEAFEDQSNIVRIDLNGDKKYRTMKFEAGKPRKSF